MQYPEQPNRNAAKPSLLASSGNEAHTVRILDDLIQSHPLPKKSKFPLRRFAWSTSALAIIAIGIVWILMERLPSNEAASSSIARLNAAQPERSTSSQELATQIPSPSSSRETSAIIITETSAANEIKPGAAKTNSATAVATASKGNSETYTNTTSSPTNTTSIHSDAPVAAKPALNHLAVRHATKTPKLVDDPSQTDSDINLIAALVAHANSEANKVQSGTSIKTQRNSEVAQNNNTDQNFAEHTNENIQALLKECKGLGSGESETCRTRICSGQWTNVPACKSK